MKVRNGFVSNSSSSSFVLYFDKEIKSIDDLDMIDPEHVKVLYNSIRQTKPTTGSVVLQDILDEDLDDYVFDKTKYDELNNKLWQISYRGFSKTTNNEPFCYLYLDLHKNEIRKSIQDKIKLLIKPNIVEKCNLPGVFYNISLDDNIDETYEASQYVGSRVELDNWAFLYFNHH